MKWPEVEKYTEENYPTILLVRKRTDENKRRTASFTTRIVFDYGRSSERVETMENLGFVPEINRQDDTLQVPTDLRNTTANVYEPFGSESLRSDNFCGTYQWRMRHYFYIHLGVFFFNAFFSGLIVWAIEGKQVPFIDCWFIGATCVFTCGLQTYSFASFRQSSQIVLLIFTVISGKQIRIK